MSGLEKMLRLLLGLPSLKGLLGRSGLNGLLALGTLTGRAGPAGHNASTPLLWHWVPWAELGGLEWLGWLGCLRNAMGLVIRQRNVSVE